MPEDIQKHVGMSGNTYASYTDLKSVLPTTDVLYVVLLLRSGLVGVEAYAQGIDAYKGRRAWHKRHSMMM